MASKNDFFKPGRQRSAQAQIDMNKKVSKWGKSSTKRQATGLRVQAEAKKADSKKLVKAKKGKK